MADTATRTPRSPSATTEGVDTRSRTDTANRTPTSTATATERTTTESKTDTPTRTATATATTSQRIVFDGGDLETFIDALWAASETSSGKLLVDEGTYRFEPLLQGDDPSRHAVVRDLRDVTIEGNDATFVFENPLLGGLKFLFGRNIEIHNLTLDYDPVPFTQGTISTFSESDRTLSLDLDEGFPGLDHEMFDAAQRVLATIHEANGDFVGGYSESEPLFFGDVSKTTERTYELKLAENEPVTGLRTGRKLTIVARNNDPVLNLHDVDQVTVRNVTINATNGAAFAIDSCTDPLIQNCSVTPPSGSDRHIGADADGFSLVDCVSSTTIERCLVDSIGDDGIVVQRNRTPVVELVDERTVDVSEWHIHAKSGDVFDVLAPTGERKGTLPPVAEISEVFPTPVERAKATEITFEEPVEDRLEEGDLIGNRATASQNFVVRDNEVRNLRGKTLRIAAGRGLVEDNVLHGASYNTIELECDTSDHFVPNGPVADVTVRNNRLSDSGLNWFAEGNPAAIRLHHNSRRGIQAEGKPNENITIVDNEAEGCASVGMELADAGSIRVVGNAVRDVNKLDYPDRDFGFSLRNVDDATLTNNSVSGSSETLSGFGIRRESGDISLSDNELSIDSESRPARLLEWIPVTFKFDRTVVPEGGSRPLAFRCVELRLFDDAGDVVHAVDVGSDTEDRVKYGVGIDGREQVESENWRWFGPEDTESVLYFPDSDLQSATVLELVGYPIEEGISAELFVNGERTDEITWQKTNRQTERLSLPTD